MPIFLWSRLVNHSFQRVRQALKICDQRGHREGANHHHRTCPGADDLAHARIPPGAHEGQRAPAQIAKQEMPHTGLSHAVLFPSARVAVAGFAARSCGRSAGPGPRCDRTGRDRPRRMRADAPAWSGVTGPRMRRRPAGSAAPWSLPANGEPARVKRRHVELLVLEAHAVELDVFAQIGSGRVSGEVELRAHSRHRVDLTCQSRDQEGLHHGGARQGEMDWLPGRDHQPVHCGHALCG